MKVRAKKHLGQHFLNDEKIAERIVESLSFEEYEQVLEIGPGMGVLTQFLLKKETAIYVAEIDKEAILYLEEHFPKLKSNILGDFLRLDLESVFEKKQIAVIGNFPYNISSQIVFKILDNKIYVPEMVGMFQKEVAERIASKEGNKVYGILSVLTQAYYSVEYLFTVHENVFTPPPKVKSGVIRLKRLRTELDVNDKLFKSIVKCGFNQRRKTLRNALKALGIPEEIDGHPFLAKRAEQLSVEDFIELTRLFNR